MRFLLTSRITREGFLKWLIYSIVLCEDKSLTRKLPSGYSLIEVLGAITVMILVILSLLTINTRSVYNAVFARDQGFATQFAQETIERARIRREENNWGVFVTVCDHAASPYPTPPTAFSLSVDCYPPTDTSRNCLVSDDSCEVRVIVSWTDASAAHRSELVTRFTNWR